MGSKTTKIELLRTDTGAKEKFDIQHAEKLLSMRNNGGWILPEDSKYQFDIENGLTAKRNK